MPKFVALLRGINVGKAKRVPMADLRALLIGLGHTHVATLLNSGNAVFQAGGGSCARHAKDISGAIAARLKVDTGGGQIAEGVIVDHCRKPDRR
jgi:uncharacterized protein (DUF1697 family)